MKRGLNKRDVDELATQIGGRDVIAERAGKGVYHGPIEDAENALVPWLKKRRAGRRPPPPPRA